MNALSLGSICHTQQHDCGCIPPERVVLAAVGIPQVFIGPREGAVSLCNRGQGWQQVHIALHPLLYGFRGIVHIVREPHQVFIRCLVEDGGDQRENRYPFIFLGGVHLYIIEPFPPDGRGIEHVDRRPDVPFGTFRDRLDGGIAAGDLFCRSRDT